MSANELSPALSDPSGGVLPRLELEHVASARYQYGTGRNPYPTGYGAKIRTDYELRCRGPLEAANGAPYRTRRVYVACYGNAGSAYVLVNGTPHYLTPDVRDLMVAAKKNRDGCGRAFMRGLDIERAASSSLRSSEMVKARESGQGRAEGLGPGSEGIVSIAGVSRADVRAAIDTWDRAADGDSGDAEIDAAVDMRDMLEAMLNYDA